MSITLEAIAARYAELSEEQDRVNARFRKERGSLAELCASLGHRYGESYVAWTIGFGDDFWTEGEQHSCAVCNHREWVSEPKRCPQYSDNVMGQVPDPVYATGPCGVIGKGE